MEEVAVSSELKFRKVELSHPKYKLSQLYPLSGLQTQTVNAAGGQEIIFQLPVKVMNLSESFLNFNFTQSANAGANNYYYIHKNPLVGIRQIQLYTQGGVYLCDLYNVNKYMDVVYFAETSQKEFLSEENSNLNSVKNYTLGAAPSNDLGDNTANTGVFAQRLVTDAAGALQAVNVDGTKAINYIERLYVQRGTAVDATTLVNIQFNMKNLKNTIFSMDKDLYFAEVINLRIVFDGSESHGYIATVTNGGIAQISTKGTIDYSGITFFVAIEKDLNIANSIVSKVHTEGMIIPIPYVYSYKQNLSSTSQTLSLRVNRAHGKKLRRIYHAPYHNTETGQYAFMRDNISGAHTVSSFYTMLNNEREQDINVDCTQAQDYMTLKNKIKGSTFVNVDSYQNKWFWVADYTSEEPLYSRESQDIMLSSGIPLDAEQKWDIYMTMNDARNMNHYDFIVTEKELMIRPGATQVQ